MQSRGNLYGPIIESSTTSSSGIFVPALVVLVPLVKITSAWRLQSPLGMIPIYIGIACSSNVFIAVGYFKTIPSEIDESAAMDGANVYRTFLTIIYPLVMPMVATVAILSTLWIWNDFQMPLVLLNQKESYWTLPLFQLQFQEPILRELQCHGSCLDALHDSRDRRVSSHAEIHHQWRDEETRVP